MPSHAIRNQADDAVIAYAGSLAEAERYAAEVRRGDYDDDPRECWIDEIEWVRQ